MAKVKKADKSVICLTARRAKIAIFAAEKKTETIMAQTVIIDSISDYNALVGMETRHPLVTVLDPEASRPMPFCRAVCR